MVAKNFFGIDADQMSFPARGTLSATMSVVLFALE